MMADFLTHLATHALGARPDIRPDVTPVFGSPVVNDTNQGPLPLHHEALTEAAIPKVLRGAERQPFLYHEAPTEGAFPQVLRNVEHQPLKETRLVRDRGASVVPVVPAQQHREHAKEPILGEEDIAASPTFKQPKVQSLDAHTTEKQSLQDKREPSPRRVQPNAHAVPAAITPQTRVAASTADSKSEVVTHSRSNAVTPVDIPAPAVHVTIGRVEVRAITPQPAPIQRLPEKNTHSNQSLDEYLRERNQGRR